MARHGAPKYIQEMRNEGEKPKQSNSSHNEGSFKRFWKRLAWLWGVIPAASAWGLYVSLVPQITLTPNEIATSDVTARPFTLTNSSIFDLVDVRMECQINSLKTEHGALTNVGSINYMPPIPSMERSGSNASIYCRQTVIHMGVPTSADVTLKVSYRPQWFPHRFTKAYRYRTVTDESGKLMWVPWGINQKL